METTEFAGKVAVVTGAARGNGAAIAAGFARAGAVVVACDLLAESLDATVESLRRQGFAVHGQVLDVADAGACDRLAGFVAELGLPLAVLVNNAGIIRRVPVGAPGFHSAWAEQCAVNVTGGMNMVSALLPLLRAGRGSVVNLASIMAFSAGPGLAGYAASKGAVAQMTKALAHDLAPDGIRVNAIAPGVIATPMTQATRDDPEAIGRFMAHTPMRRPGEPEELVGPVLFLAGSAASYVTGAVLPVDGGYLAA